GKWIAYFSDQSGEYELWVRPSDARPGTADDKKDEKKDDKKDDKAGNGGDDKKDDAKDEKKDDKKDEKKDDIASDDTKPSEVARKPAPAVSPVKLTDLG